MAAKASTLKAPHAWYSHPVYARYWQQHQQAKAWMRSHQVAYRKAVESYFSSPCYLAFRRSGQHAYDSSRTQTSTVEDQALFKEEEAESESEEEVEYDLSNREVTEELRQYFVETERHREERQRQQQLEAARLDDYVNADHGLYYKPCRAVGPPAQRPGEQRKAEMQHLYRDSTAKILAMEAAVQLRSKHCDRKQPRYWPVIPLKF
ncbi:gem-associated protein 8 [Tupaia chinensis]|uniref:Gem-associated protein 8 n=1 Tax=Tupaia chinensis TaxID=246437 RepID=L9KI86_TUPCH|nr:gem-associated protein 8 [Tupaia chinensis]ELW62209.1 Gem-associated protein 8 [Tupaia chinensis]